MRFTITQNFTAVGDLSSISFDYKDCLFYKSKFVFVNTALDDFNDIIHGRVWSGFEPNNYFGEETFCYLITDGELFKIGKSKDPKKRLQSLKTANPRCQLVCYSNLVPEKFFHDIFKASNVDREWFRLDIKDVNLVKSFMELTCIDQVKCLMRLAHRRVKKSKPSRTEYVAKKQGNVKLTFGKHSGRSVKSFTTLDDLQYLSWLKNTYERGGKINSTLYQAVKAHLNTFILKQKSVY